MKQKLSYSEKLKSKKAISQLFSNGSVITSFPLRLIFIKSTFHNNVAIKSSFSVSKRNFKHAVARNRIKRLLREAYRKNKYIVFINNEHQFSFMFLYIGKEMPSYDLIEAKMKILLTKFKKKI